ncbi:MAG TPA: tetratricopeptide repeat protein [Azospira sp.]|nr:tetratricopeptide repeat protein [Azospira sp.]
MKPLLLASLVTGALLAGACSTVQESGPMAGEVRPVQVIRHGASNPQALYATGRYYQGQVRYDQAIEYYRRLLESDPKHAEGHNALGVIYAMQGRSKEAEAEFRAALETAPGAAHIHNNLGYLLLRQGRLNDAVVSLDRALSLDPANTRARDNLETAYSRMVAMDSRNASAPLAAQGVPTHEAVEQAVAVPIPAPTVSAATIEMAPNPSATASPSLAPGVAPNPVPSTASASPLAVASATSETSQGGLEMAQVGANVYELRQPVASKAPPPPPPVLPTTAAIAAAALAPATPSRLHLEVANGNGVEGLAGRTSRFLQKMGYPSARLTNQKPFVQPMTEIQYRPGYEAQANHLQRVFAGKGTLAEAKGLRSDIQVRVVLGQNLRTTEQLAELEAGLVQLAANETCSAMD